MQTTDRLFSRVGLVMTFDLVSFIHSLWDEYSFRVVSASKYILNTRTIVNILTLDPEFWNESDLLTPLSVHCFKSDVCRVKLMSMVHMINPPKYCKNVTFLIFKSWGGGYKINNNVCISTGLGEVNVSVYLQE